MVFSLISWVRENFTYNDRISRGTYIAVNIFYWLFFGFLAYGILKYRLHFKLADLIYSFGPFPPVIDSILSFLFFAAMMILILLAVLTFLFTICQTIRRLHDVDVTGWLWPLKLLTISIGIIPIPIGLLLDVVLCLWDGTPGPNKYGEDPKGRVPVTSGEYEEIEIETEKVEETGEVEEIEETENSV
ncbi:hypothetical protein MmiAt1_11740 [Methanimicrococcus sp. At1]|uniref:DUF805 domain-containing protein n=1 Tax=Methanimicrococcus hacksteinii TaxID=3028293 RepID=A0ABU3VQ92_9EURY|nr:DUF805 domain-containing protein [Methanimicrococcus sp. At1]MDV0445589.1 hypothetical protein [Methanimicrococcus sp. At1]